MRAETAPRAGREPVAIVGMAVMLPGAGSLEQYWHNLTHGVDAITDVPAHRWDPEFYAPDEPHRADRVYCRRGGFVDDNARFQALPFGIMPASVAGIDPDQLIALRVAAEAVQDAGGLERLGAPDRVGVILGRGGYLTPAQARWDQRVRVSSQVVQVLRELLPDVEPARLEQVRERFVDQLGPHRPEDSIAFVPNLAASRVANRLNLRGPAYVVDAACASALLAVDHGIAELSSGRCDVVLAGAMHHCHDITLWSVFSQLKALSRQGLSRPFDSSADGLLIGEGTGVVALKRLSDALRDDDRIYAVIRGSGISSDGRAASLFNPEPAGQTLAVRRAWASAGLDSTAPGAVGLLEAHGTATPTGDAAELITVAETFGRYDGGPRAVIGSVKSMIGHTMPAAGIAGLVKTALAVYHGTLLPTLHCDDPRPELERTRFTTIDTARPWEGDGPRRAGVNAFGFGGINSHVIVEQAPGRAAAVDPMPHITVREPDLALWLADTGVDGLAARLAADDAALREAATAMPAAVAGPCRLGVVDPTDQRLAIARRAVSRGTAWRGHRDVWFTPEPLLAGARPGRIGFIYPGLEAEFAPRVDDVARRLGRDGQDWSAQSLGEHGIGVIAVSRLLHDALERIGVHPDATAGHSIGEWTAGVTSGLISGAAVDEFLSSFDPESVRVPGLLFAAVGAGVDRVAPILPDYPSVVVSHDNAPAQCIVCGTEEQVLRLVDALRARNVLCQALPFRSGFHTPMLEPYLGPMREVADHFELHEPRVPIWSATIAAPFPADERRVRELFVRHLVEPVRFRATVRSMYTSGVKVFLQVGTGQLSSVVGDNLRDQPHLAMPVNVAHRTGMDQLRRVATALWVEGATPDLSGLEAPAGTVSRGPLMLLDLGGAMVRLGAGAADLLGVTQDRAVEPGRVSADLRDLAGRSPAAAELAALLQDTAQHALAVLGAAHRAPVVPARRTRAPARIPASTTLRVGVEDMPYLMDHCFFPQPADWPDPADRWPVMPATTVVHHMMRLVEQASPGMRAVRVGEARFNRWVVAAPPVDIDVTVTAAGPDSCTVAFGGFARATVHTAQRYPDSRPEPWRHDPATEAAPAITAERMYAERWMFHGPLFYGITALLGDGESHVRGRIAAPAVPGGLLDNVGQLLGYWVLATQPHRTMVFPVGVGDMRFYGPDPAPGTDLECVVRITEITNEQITADCQLIDGDEVWAQLDGWVIRRFDSHPHTKRAERFPGRYALSFPQPEGWATVFELWPDLATRELAARNMLGTAGYAQYERHPGRTRRQWLLGRIAAKDAVRLHLWAEGAGEIYPAELEVGNEPSGRPWVRGIPGRDRGDHDVSLAHCAEVGVAIARPRPPGAAPGAPGVGIDVVELVDPEENTVRYALGGTERALLDRLGEAGNRGIWFLRFWAAKEAAGKAEGTGLAGNPRRFVVVDATASTLTVEVTDPEAGPVRRYRVAYREIANPEELAPRRYTVAWTWGPDTDGATDQNPGRVNE